MAKAGKAKDAYKRVIYLLVAMAIIAAWVAVNVDLEVGLKYIALIAATLAGYKYLVR